MILKVVRQWDNQTQEVPVPNPEKEELKEFIEWSHEPCMICKSFTNQLVYVFFN